jgi:hypothetical protein
VLEKGTAAGSSARVSADLVAGSGIEFEPRGVRELKGVGEWPHYAVVDA